MSRSVVHGRVETAKMKIHCVVKGYHECLFDVEVGEHFELSKVCNSRGQLGRIQRELVPFLWPIACLFYVAVSLTLLLNQYIPMSSSNLLLTTEKIR